MYDLAYFILHVIPSPQASKVTLVLEQSGRQKQSFPLIWTDEKNPFSSPMKRKNLEVIKIQAPTIRLNTFSLRVQKLGCSQGNTQALMLKQAPILFFFFFPHNISHFQYWEMRRPKGSSKCRAIPGRCKLQYP